MTSSQLHKPVLLEEVLKSFSEHFSTDDKIIGVDGTFGRGGHSKALMDKYPGLHIMGIDQDTDAIDFAKKEYSDLLKEERLSLIHTNFADVESLKTKINSVNYVLLDIGVSSPQLDNADRGFSFYNDGPLDMRMNQDEGETAAEVLNSRDPEELRALFLEFGEVYASDKLLEAIVSFRDGKKFSRTLEFADLIEKKCGWRKKGMHPATLYFQALRIYVNDELEKLKKALTFYTEELCSGGIIMVITFHSLEDRIVKRFFKNNELGKPVNKKVIKPTMEEEAENKRARSAKLRVFKKD